MSGFAGRPGLTDIETAEVLLDESRSFLSAAEQAFDFFGFKAAADNLRRYRSGAGGKHTYTDEEIAEHPALLEAEDRNRTNFERSTFTTAAFRGRRGVRLRRPLASGHEVQPTIDVLRLRAEQSGVAG